MDMENICRIEPKETTNDNITTDYEDVSPSALNARTPPADAFKSTPAAHVLSAATNDTTIELNENNGIPESNETLHTSSNSPSFGSIFPYEAKEKTPPSKFECHGLRCPHYCSKYSE